MSIYQLRQIRERRYKRWPERRPRVQKTGMMSPAEKERVARLHEQGYTVSQIAEAMNRHPKTVERRVRELEEAANHGS